MKQDNLLINFIMYNFPFHVGLWLLSENYSFELYCFINISLKMLLSRLLLFNHKKVAPSQIKTVGLCVMD